MRWATATPPKAPATWAARYTGTSRQGNPPCEASASVTAGLKCAPEIGPNVRINATRAAPVAIVFARSAIATFPPASRSPMMPEPTTAASSKAVPIASATARRTTTLLCSGFHGADERAHDLAIHHRGYCVNVDALPAQKCPCVLDVVYPCRFNVDVVETCLGELGDIPPIFQRSGNAADPQEHALSHYVRNLTARDHIRNSEPPPRLQNPKGLAQHAVFVA